MPPTGAGGRTSGTGYALVTRTGGVMLILVGLLLISGLWTQLMIARGRIGGFTTGL
jgi:hypothetical protein